MPTKLDLAKLVVSLEAESKQLRKEIKSTKLTLSRWEKNVSRSVNRAKRQFNNLKGTVVAAIAALAGGKFVQAQRDFAVLNATLETAAGSSKDAAREFAKLEAFAKTTPFSLREAINSFVKLKNLGLDPSIESLKSYGNTASALGKTLDQFVEAIADATVGEFERLKEFGIKASKQGDLIKFRFRGITKEVANNSAEIQKYLKSIGDVEFAGALEKRAKSLDGVLSNLGESFQGLVRDIGEAGVTQAITAVASNIGFLVDKARDGITAFRSLFKLRENETDIKLITERIDTLKDKLGDLREERARLNAIRDAPRRTLGRPGASSLGNVQKSIVRTGSKIIELEAKLQELTAPAKQVGEALGEGIKAGSQQGLEKLKSDLETFKELVNTTRESLAGDTSNPLTKGTIIEVTRALDKAKTLQSAGDTKGQLEAAVRAVEAIQVAREAGNISRFFAQDLLGQAEELGVGAGDKMARLGLDEEALQSEAEKARDIIQSNFEGRPFKIWIEPTGPNRAFANAPNMSFDDAIEAEGAK